MLTRAGTIALRALVELARCQGCVLSGPELAKRQEYLRRLSKSCCNCVKPIWLRHAVAAVAATASAELLRISAFKRCSTPWAAAGN